MIQSPSTEVMNAVTDLTRLLTVGGLGVNIWFIKGAFQELKELRNDVHGKGGLSERLARIEGANGGKS